LPQPAGIALSSKPVSHWKPSRDALEQALWRAQPKVLNRDQGAQVTSTDVTSRLEVAGRRISLDRRGRALDHVLIARLWRTVKYEEVYVKDDETPRQATLG
jgi:putative transposase